MVREHNITAAPADEETERIHFLRINMAEFQAYIFKEDVEKLQSEAGSATQKSGSLFGQWTSTGNPVVQYVVPSAVNRADSESYGKKLWEGYRVCHIGEWQSVRSYRRQTAQDAERHLLSNFKGGKPKRFLVLDVEATDIKPYLLEGENQRRRGILDRLDGVNPFNRADVDPQQSTGQHFRQPSHHKGQSTAAQGGDWSQFQPRPQLQQQSTGQHFRQPSHHKGQSTAAQGGDWSQFQPRPQLQPATTRNYQWYSGSMENGTFEKILNDFKRIASQGKVEITRDKTTEDLSMAFRDKHRFKNWQVDFPCNFPSAGALLIEDSDSQSKCKKHPQVTNTDQIQAVRKMTNFVERPFFY